MSKLNRIEGYCLEILKKEARRQMAEEILKIIGENHN